MWKVTGDPVWRTRGYEIFQGIERSTKTAIGYASVDGVDLDKPNKKDAMPRRVSDRVSYLHEIDQSPIKSATSSQKHLNTFGYYSRTTNIGTIWKRWSTTRKRIHYLSSLGARMRSRTSVFQCRLRNLSFHYAIVLYARLRSLIFHSSCK